MFVLSFLFIGSLFIEAESIEVDVSNKSESLDISNGNDHNVYFDCDSVFETNKNKINIRLIDDYKIIPEVSGNGNISFDIINSDYCLNEFELLLPQEDGKLELILYFGDELVRKNVFSSYKDGVYGVSISNYLVEDEDYNDDYCIDEDQGLYTSDAKLYGYYYSNKTYMIVINQSNPSSNGGNINLIIDFLMWFIGGDY